MERPAIYMIKGGWAAQGHGWAVHGATKEEVEQKFQQALREHAEIKARPALAAQL
jgi:hypothetical protein